jgi:hypothetical protein
MNIKEIDASSPGNTCTNQWQSMMSGLIPFLSYEPVRQTPRADLVKTIREYVNSGLKPQQEIAREIGLRYFVIEEMTLITNENHFLVSRR